MTDAAHLTHGPDPAITPLLRGIRSRRTFLPDAIDESDLELILEAARWAPSTWNAQPWRFVVVRRSDAEGFAAVLDALSVSNRRWAPQAPLLIVVAAWPRLHDGTPNRHAVHDVGLASAFLMVQAAALNLHVQPMAGVDPEATRIAAGIPKDHEVLTVLAVGRVGEGSAVPIDIIERDERRRTRMPLDEIARDGTWERPFEVWR